MEGVFDKTKFLTALRQSFASSGLTEYLTEENEARFSLLCERLFAENKRYNLTAIKDEEKAALLHFCDSVALAPLIPEGARVLDVGCGGGFPSLPLAIVRPDVCVTAMDATEKRVVYVRDSALLLGLQNITALSLRAEEAAHTEMRESFDAVTARAVAALPVLSELCLPFLRVGGVFFAMKGAGADDEITASTNAFLTLGGTLREVRALTVTDGTEAQTRFAVTVEKTKKTAKEYPRHFSRISKKPL